MDLLIRNLTVLPEPGKPEVLKQAYLGITDGKISWLSTDAPQEPAAETLDGTHLAAIPGLVNAHTHLPMTLLRGAADDYELQTWLFDHIFPLEAKLTEEAVYTGTQLALMECLAGGTVSVSDMYDHCPAIVRAMDEAGIKANISRGLTAFDPEFRFATAPGGVESRELYEHWHGHDGGRIQVEMSIHGEYTSRPEVWKEISDYAFEKGLGIHLHLSETEKEHEECLHRWGVTPMEAFEQAGVFRCRVTAAHCVWVSEQDRKGMAHYGAAAVHNPVSNLKLASGIAPVNEMLADGVTVALGTDGMASNNNHDLFEEIKLAAMLQKTRARNAAVLPAGQALAVATLGGAKAQGRENEMGALRVGMDADLCLINLDQPHLQPCHDLVSTLVYSARGSDVVRTMVRGKTLYKNGEFLTIDREKVFWDLEHCAIPTVFDRK